MGNTVNFTINLTTKGKSNVVDVTTAVEQLDQVVKNTQESMKGSLSNFNDYGFALQGIQSAVSQLTSTLNDLTAESRSFGAAMASANTMADKSGEDFDNLKGKVADLAKEVPMARDALANGLYQVVSNGVPEDNWLDFLNASARSSVGGMAELTDVVKVTSTVIKNYALEWQDAAEVQDKIQLAAKNGVTSFSEMAQALPRVSANASTLGVTVDELMASFSTLTGVSGNTAEVSTQLAAIFTALIKPSSEATEMAQQMGIQFDAAAIKAAGGMQNFLVTLNKSVTEYAKANGILEQEIYGKLFGSAESLRAITPLVGNLASKYNENVGLMRESTGEMDKAYDKLGHTGAAQLTLLKNSLAGIADALNTVVGPALPVLNVTTQIGMSVMAVKTLTQGFASLGLVTKTTSLMVKTFGPIVQVCSATMRGAAVSATALKLAIRGLMISTVVGAALVALTTAIEHLMNTSDEAADKTEDFKEAEQAFISTSGQTKAALDTETKKLRELIAAKQDTTEAVKNLNEKYGTVFGNHKTAADWYDVLTKKSQIYARQLGYEAQMKILSTQLAEKQIQLQDNFDKRRDLWKSGGARQTTTRVVGTGSSGATMTATYEEDTQAYKDLKAEARELLPSIDAIQRKLSIAEKKMAECSTQIRSIDNAGKQHNDTLKVSSLNYNQVKEKIDEYQKRLGSATNDPKEAIRLNGILKQLEARKKSLEKTYSGLDTSNKSGKNKPEPKFYKDPKTAQQLEKNINYYQGKLSPNNTAEDQKLRKQIQIWQEKKTAIELANKEAERPLKLDSIDAYEKDISILREMINATKITDVDKAKTLQQQLEAEERELGELKVKIGMEVIPEIKVKDDKNILRELDEKLKNLKLDPIDVNFKAQDFERIKSLFNIDTSNFESVKNAMVNIKAITDPTAKGFAIAGSACEALGGAMQQLGADSAAAKAGMIMAAIGQIVLSFGQAMESASKNWITWLAFGLTGTAQLISIIGTISKFATGGIVGGNQTSGDNVLVRVNSGEMILNAAQQARLFALANGAAVYGASAQVGTSFAQGAALQGITVNASRLQAIGNEQTGGKQSISLRLQGRDLVGVLANETRSNRRRSNIKIS